MNPITGPESPRTLAPITTRRPAPARARSELIVEMHAPHQTTCRTPRETLLLLAAIWSESRGGIISGSLR